MAHLKPPMPGGFSFVGGIDNAVFNIDVENLVEKPGSAVLSGSSTVCSPLCTEVRAEGFCCGRYGTRDRQCGLTSESRQNSSA